MKKNNEQYFSILQWIVERGIVSEKSEAFDFRDRPFLLDVLTDFNPDIVVTACAQVGKSVAFSLKTLFATKHLGFNVIYTFPTDDSVREFVGSKFNKILQANRHEFDNMDTDSIERKELNDRFIFFKGTVSKTGPISTSADLLIHDEVSRSDQGAIETYKSRTKASQYKGRWLFSNPGSERDELDLAWSKSDQKEWVIECPHCNDRHFLQWPESIDIEKKCYVCRACKEPIADEVRRKGQWEAQNGKSKISGYHISHLMCPWITAEEVIDDSEGDPGYFNNFVLGLAYSPGDLSVTKTTILDLWTPKDLTTGNIYIGVDVGNIKHYTIGTEKGIIKIGRFSKESDLDDIIRFWKPTAGVVDAMPDSTFSKYLCETYPWMRMSYFMENNNNPQTIVWWGDKDKSHIVYSHRDRILDRMLLDMIEASWLISVKADKEFQLFIKHFETLRRVKVTNNKGIERYVWDSTTGEDHYCFHMSTPVLTKTGYKAIKDIKVGEEVLTRAGYKRVLHAGITKENADVVEATFSDGRTLICTEDHPFWVKGIGMKPLKSLLSHDILYTCQNQKQSSSTELSSDDTPMQNVEPKGCTMYQVGTLESKEQEDSTRKYGKTRTGIFRKDLLFIISTTIRSITNYLTLRHFRGPLTSHNILKKSGKTQSFARNKLRELEEKLQIVSLNLKSGSKHQKERLKPRSILRTCLRGLSLTVLYVVHTLSQKAKTEGSSALSNVEVDGMLEHGERTSQGITLKQIRKIEKKEDVYNLHVEDQHEYFANGILVSNCFATLYYRLAVMAGGSGTFFSGGGFEEKPTAIDANNVYDVSRLFADNNE